MAALQREISQADADARTAALFATLEADEKKASSQVRSAALADLARLRSCAGSLSSAWLTARPGPADVVRWHLTAHAADAVVHTSTCIAGSQPCMHYL